jgi:hypothetical protein
MSIPIIVVAERDRRSLNAMDTETKLIHARLEEWSNETRRHLESRGYPKESYYHKWACLGIQPNPGHEPELSPRSANVDIAVTRLIEVDKAVIWRFYMQWRPVKIWEHLPGIDGKHKFDVVLKRARWRVDGYLKAIE